MAVNRPEIIVVTRDVSVAHAVHLVAAERPTEWCQSFSSALLAVGAASEVLVFDGAMDAPLSRLLPTVFVEQRPGRRAIVLQPEGAHAPTGCDPRITALPWPLSLDALTTAIGGEKTASPIVALTAVAVAA